MPTLIASLPSLSVSLELAVCWGVTFYTITEILEAIQRAWYMQEWTPGLHGVRAAAVSGLPAITNSQGVMTWGSEELARVWGDGSNALALAEDPSMIPSTRVRWLTTAWDSSPEGLMPSSGLCQPLHSQTHVCARARVHMHTQMNLSFYFKRELVNTSYSSQAVTMERVRSKRRLN